MQGTPEATAEFAGQFAPGLLCLADPERKAYQAYGLERGNLFQTFLNPKVWSAISRSRKKGYEVEPPPPGQDAMQMSAPSSSARAGRSSCHIITSTSPTTRRWICCSVVCFRLGGASPLKVLSGLVSAERGE